MCGGSRSDAAPAPAPTPTVNPAAQAPNPANRPEGPDATARRPDTVLTNTGSLGAPQTDAPGKAATLGG